MVVTPTMKFDFLTLPAEMKAFSISERMKVYPKAFRDAKIGGKLALLYFVSLALAIWIAGLVVKRGGSGDLVLGSLLATHFLDWFVGWFYLVNKYVNPRLVEIIEQRKK